MAKGVIYVEETLVKNLVKIGKMESTAARMIIRAIKDKRPDMPAWRFAIEVDDYEEKEELLHNIFAAGNVHGTDLYALETSYAVQLLAAFEGEQLYMKGHRDEKRYSEEYHDYKVTSGSKTGNKFMIPDGEYYLECEDDEHGTVRANMTVLGNDFIIRKGSSLLPWKKYRDTEPLRRRAVNVEGKHTLEDAVCRSHNEAASWVMGYCCSGRTLWKNQDGVSIEDAGQDECDEA